jgi:uncharacterized protein (DUF1697 family)
MAQYLSLLRGINVGGKSMIKMSDLKVALENDGFTDVKTYIQSGNVFVTTPERSRVNVANRVSAVIKKHFKHNVDVVAFTKSDWQKVVDGAPKWWGTGDGWKHDLLVLIPPFKVKEVVTGLGETNAEVERIEAGTGVIYASIVVAKFSRSVTSKMIGKPIYKRMTVRNYNTSNKLMDHFD